MTGLPISRRAVRESIAAGLAAGLPSAQAVYGYQETDLQGQSPTVRVYTAGAQRPQLPATGIRSRFRYTVELWVLFEDEAAAENTLDQLEYELITWLGANQIGDLWQALMYEGESVVDNVRVSAGSVWLVEEIHLVAEVYG